MELFRKAVELIEAGTRFALATVIRSTGSTPQKAGAMAIFEPDGAVWGTLGGGCLEAESRRRALTALDTGEHLVFDLSLDSDYGWDDGLICGGNVRVFVDVHPGSSVDAFREANGAVEHRLRGVLEARVTAASAGWRWIAEGDIRDDAHRIAIDEEQSRHLRTDNEEVYIGPIIPKPQLLIAGGGHVGKATARLGSMLGFEVTVVDDRMQFANATHIPEADHVVCADIEQYIRDYPISSDTHVVIVTRGHQHDADALRACIGRPAAYIGMIGSKRKLLLIRKDFLRDGVCTEEEFDRVYSPIGFDIGARTIEEIAVCIAAQMIAVRRRHVSASKQVPEVLSL